MKLMVIIDPAVIATFLATNPPRVTRENALWNLEAGEFGVAVHTLGISGGAVFLALIKKPEDAGPFPENYEHEFLLIDPAHAALFNTEFEFVHGS